MFASAACVDTSVGNAWGKSMEMLKSFSVEQIRRESRERGWLFSLVAAWCLLFGVFCLLLSIAVLVKAALVDGISTRPVVGLGAIAAVILVSTALMWRQNVWGRNIAIVTVAAISWVLGESISRKTGGGFAPQVMTIVFAAISLSYFTSAAGREMFRPPLEDEPPEEPAP